MKRINRAISTPEPNVKPRAAASEQPRVLRLGGPRPGIARPRDFSVLGQPTRTPPTGLIR